MADSKMNSSDGRKRPSSPNREESSKKRPKTSSSRELSRKRATGFSNEIFKETSYVFQNGGKDVARRLRYVIPYYFTFESFAKGRWVGRTVYDVFSKEFQSEKPSYYKKAIEAGKITVDGKVAVMDTIVKRNKTVSHRIHRHEPPVVHQPLKIVHQDEHVVVIDKPPSIPVHPCGRYRHNTIVFILAKEHNIKNLHTIHRLDRLTSGILMFSKSLYKAQKLEEEIRQKSVTKTYLARVMGEFPEEQIDCNEPIVVVSHKLGVCHVDPNGKPSSTSFQRLYYDGNTSLIKCVPKTGRMHQIRVHLQWLGYPIINDPLYNHPAWGPDKGCKGNGINSMDEVLSKIVQSRFIDDIIDKTSDEIPSARKDAVESPTVIDSNKISSSETSSEQDNIIPTNDSTSITLTKTNVDATGTSSTNTTDTNTTNTRGTDITGTSSTDTRTECSGVMGSSLVFPKDPSCTECGLSRSDPTSDELMMYLHALQYSGDGWEYKTEPPSWADTNWTLQK